MKLRFYTLGCKVNLFETQALEQLARERGHEIVPADADAVILNTCSVTSVSEHKNLRAIHKLKRENPAAIVAVCGCYAQLDPDKLGALEEVDLVFGTAERAGVIEACEQALAGQGPEGPRGTNLTRIFEPLQAGVPDGRTRALLKIQDGCDNYCTYCIIPYVRGHVRSMAPETVLGEARRLAAQGVCEIVVTGIEIASYGVDLTPRLPLTDLLCRLLEAVPQVRIRLGSLEPRIADEAFCRRLSAYPNLARHFHLSLQSGSDTVLKRMGRKYTAAQFKETADRLRAYFPGASVTTDLIVGFPGETEAEFAETLTFLKACAFADVHVFPYSIREGTVAAKMEGQLPNSVKNARAEAAKEVVSALSQSYRAAFIGKTVEVLFEHRTADGFWSGHSGFAFPVYAKLDGWRKNQVLSVRLDGLHRDGLRGTALQDGAGDV